MSWYNAASAILEREITRPESEQNQVGPVLPSPASFNRIYRRLGPDESTSCTNNYIGRIRIYICIFGHLQGHIQKYP